MTRDDHDRTVVERADPLVGSVLDRRFKIEYQIAAGGFGAIYRAKHVSSGLEVALKVLLPRFTADVSVVTRFRREGTALLQLRNPHTITAYELGEAPDGTLYIVMELLGGVSLFERRRAHGKLEWKRAVAIARGVCASLAEAHAHGIVHRDLKPTNIHLETVGDEPDFVKVLDFGIAKILHGGPQTADVTNAGQMIGTLDYMPPEQMVGGPLTPSSDLYTLGIVLYEMIAGCRPFPEATSAGTALAAMLKPPPPLASVAPVPAELDRIVMRCLAREPEHRFATADELSAALDQVIESVEDAGATLSLAATRDNDATQITPAPVMTSQLDPAAGAPIPYVTLRGIVAQPAPRPPVVQVEPPMIAPPSQGGDELANRVVWVVVFLFAAVIGVELALHI